MPAAEQQAAVQTEVVEMPEGRIAFEVTELDDAFNVGGKFYAADGSGHAGGRKESVRTFLATAKLYAATARKECRKDPG